MSHQVLARKWRPGNFTEMVGQQHVLQALVNALESGRLHHAYLFTGTRGVGKTTVARILAKCLNCDTGVTATPCGECGACAEIAEGRSVDLIEVDAASKTKVEDTRELLENVQYTPTHARYKIYLIDEVHMLSNHSFNALLKTLEEPPPHAMFLLATTDPQKLPATVLSRCLQFNLKNMQPEQIVAHLEHILGAESVSADAEALALIARAAEGSMRDALSLTDQAIAYGEGKLVGAEVAEMLGTVDRGRVLDLVAAILDEDPAAVLSLVSQIAEHAPDFVSTLDELSNILHQMTIAQTVPDALDTSWPDQARIVELAARATIDDTQLFWQMAVGGRREVHLASSARAGLEMILLRMIAFRPAAVFQPQTAAGDSPAKKPEPPVAPVALDVTPEATPIPKIQSSVDRASAASLSAEPPSSLNGRAAPGSSENSPARTPEVAESDEVTTQAAQPKEANASLFAQEVASAGDSVAPSDLSREPSVSRPREAPAKNTVANGAAAAPQPAISQVSAQVGQAQEADETHSGRVSLADLNMESWPELFEAFQFGGILHNIALNLELREVVGEKVRFNLAERDATLLNERHPAQLAQALKRHLGHDVGAEITVADHSGHTPANHRAALAAARLAAAEQAISSDDALHALMKAFDGQIIPGSIRPNVADGEPESHGADSESRA
ncbi:MAG: DNA polymerase III subunit gamma/tau [Luminiphilus sp.]